MQDYSITKICADGSIFHYVDETSGDVIKSYAGRVEGRIDGRLFAFNVNRSWLASLHHSRLMSRLLRLQRINVLKIEDNNLLIIYNGEVFVFELTSGQLRKVFEFARTRYVHTQSISMNGRQIVVGEYGNVGDSKDVGVLISKDSGSSWGYRSLFSRGTTKNILSVKFDPHSETYWVFTGDKSRESGIFLYDQEFNLLKTLGRGLNYRAISSFHFPSEVIWLTNNPFGESRVFTYHRSNGEVEAGQILPGPVWYSTEIGSEVYCCTAAENVAGEAGNTVYVMRSQDYVQWEPVCQFSKDYLNKRFFLFGLGTFPVHSISTDNVYLNLDAVNEYDGCVVKIQREVRPIIPNKLDSKIL